MLFLYCILSSVYFVYAVVRTGKIRWNTKNGNQALMQRVHIEIQYGVIFAVYCLRIAFLCTLSICCNLWHAKLCEDMCCQVESVLGQSIGENISYLASWWGNRGNV